MSDNFQLLKSDDDVLLFDKNTFLVGRFKELYLEQIRAKIYSNTNNHHREFVIFSNQIEWKVSDRSESTYRIK